MTAGLASAARAAEPSDDEHDVASSAAPTLLLAIACGIIAANIYYLQPLAAQVAQAIGLSQSASGLSLGAESGTLADFGQAIKSASNLI